ncbi:ABC transporter permease subunit [Paenibacillus dakarensis]|uniref:ABC transporter permease subunit n=1 Tax=Paenibacillus dakarensis TaxID=1527293 RepID=UPI0006D59A8E|nr:ABC transporter permease subunit [Paenibacillus dakarensis]
MKKKKKNAPLWIGIGMLLLLLFIMYVGPHLPLIDKELKGETFRWVDKPGGKLQLPAFAPSEENWLGTDKKGVDHLSKVVVAAEDTLYLILMVTVLRYMIGVPLGLLARKKNGFFYQLIMLLNQFFSYLPSIFSAILLLALPSLLFSPNRYFWSLFVLAVVEAGRVAITVQAKADRISKETYMEAGEALGLSAKRKLRAYYIPAMTPELIVNFCADMGKVTILLGQLAVMDIFITQEWKEVNYYTMKFVSTSFNWTTLISDYKTQIFLSKFDFVFYPALGLMLIVVTFNLLGEGLRRKFFLKA